MATQTIPKSVKILLGVTAIFMPIFLILPFFFWGNSDGSINLSEQNLQAARLQPVGKLVIGEPVNPATNTETAAAEFDVEATYNNTCAACHATPALGAPVFGDHDAWQARLDGKGGFDALYESGLHGVAGTAMTAKGGANITDEQFRQMVEYMLENSNVSY